MFTCVAEPATGTSVLLDIHQSRSMKIAEWSGALSSSANEAYCHKLPLSSV